MIRIAAEHIHLLRNSTGKAFTDLLDRLIRSSAATVGVPASAVLDNPRVNHPDGGVDTQVTVGAQSDPWGYFNAPSIWQYKAVALTDFSASKIKEEINGESKDYVRSLLKQGYAYRLCVADDGSAKKKAAIKALLVAEIAKVNPTAPEPIVLFASEIVSWVNTFPAIAAEMLGYSMMEFSHFSTWRDREQAITKTFVATLESAVIFESIQSHLDWKTKPSSARLTVSGDAGVGKSRTVFEAIAALPEVAPLVLYTEDEDKALDLARAMANHKDLYAVIVADECLDATAFQLAKILQGVKNRVRLITIDNALEGADKSDLRLSRISTRQVEEIAKANFPDIDQNRRYRYCQLAEGYLRFAIFLCDNDSLIVQQGHLGELLSDTKSYLGTLFGNDGPFERADFDALMVISLVERCGVVGNVYSELEQLCTLAGLNPKDVRDRLHRMQKMNGLVARAGRYFYVTPTPIAMVCFQAAWSKWAELDPKAFLTNFPQDLVPSFLARMARASEEVGKVVNAYFRNWELSRRGDIFANAHETEQFLLLVRASPDEMVPRLHNLVLTATPEQLGKHYRGGRRNLVAEANEIASFPQWFFLAEEIVFTLARHETEPDLGNNATNVWAGLFPIMSYVATPFAERLKLIRKRIVTGDRATRILCVTALQAALDDHSVHMVSNQPYVNRIAPTPWHPTTWDELREYMKACLAELNTLSGDTDDTVREKATGALIRCILSLVFNGYAEQAKQGAGNLPAHLRPILRSELREFILLDNSEHSPHSPEEKQQRAKILDEWIKELASTDIHDRLVEEVGPESWSRHLEQAEWEGRISELAAHLLQNEIDFERELPWLNSGKARSSVEFGVQLGRLDENLLLLDRIVQAARTNSNANLVRGYFTGVSEKTQSKGPSNDAELTRTKLNASLDEMWQNDPVLAFNVMTPSGDFVRSFSRAILAVREKEIPARFLRSFGAWNGPRHTSPVEARIAAETLLEAARNGDEDAADAGIEFIAFLLIRSGDSEDKLRWLQTVFNDESLDVVFGLLEQFAVNTRKRSHWFTPMFARALPANPDRATSILIQLMKIDDYETSRTAAELFSSVATVRPQELMDGIGKLMLSDEQNVNFLFRKFPIVSLPEGVIIEWLEKHGLEGARLLARHVPRPFIGSNGPDLNPITGFILERYGNDERVFSSWVAGMYHGQVFAGSIANHTQTRASMAEPFLSFPIEAVRRWAQGEVAFAEQNIDDLRLSEEERF
jgi:hypothetical protein